MKEPSEKDIKKEKQSELDKIANMNAKCVAGYQVIRNTIFNGIEDADLTKMNKYVAAEYGKVYTGLKGMIIDALNDAKDKNVKLVEKLLNVSLPLPKRYEVLPNTSAFKYTNRVFENQSVSLRSQNAADVITKIIADGRNEGLTIKDIQKKIDTVMGFRDAQGKLTDKSKKLIESGKFSHRNGSIYETYRIARTETMRMNAFAKYDQFLELKKDYPNVRLKLKSTIDGRERSQSALMNGYVSNADGEFLYPDGKYYRLGEAPARYSINDREVQYIVFLDNKEVQEQIKKQETAEVGNFKEFYNDLKPAAEALRKEFPSADAISTEKIGELFSEDYTKHYAVVGNLTQEVQKTIDSNVSELRVSFENLLKNLAKHPEIDFAMYNNITNYIANSPNRFPRGNRLITFIEQNNKIYELVIKTTQDKSINYFNSFRVSDIKDLQSYANKKR